jgi:hypothetical protein
MRDDLGAPPLFAKRAFGQVRGPDLLLMPLGHFQMIETGLGLIEQTPTGFRKLALIRRHNLVAPFFRFLPRWCIPHVHDQRFALRPRCGRDFLLEVAPDT